MFRLRSSINAFNRLSKETISSKKDALKVPALSAFANMCRNSSQTDLVPFAGAQTAWKRDTITYMNITETVDGISESMLAARVPKPALIPSMLDTTKQPDRIDFIACRLTDTDVQRIATTISDLRKGRSVAWIGHSGIGKSTEANFVMMEFFRNLGKPGWPSRIAHRVCKQLYEYVLGSDGSISCKIKMPCAKLEPLEQFCEDEETLTLSQRVVLFLELAESESDPLLARVPTFIALSSREADKTLKSMIKGRRLSFKWVRVHTPAELNILCRMMLVSDRRDTLACLGLLENATDEDALCVVNDRVKVIGGLVREIFLMPASFRQYVSILRGNEVPLNACLPELNPFNIPSVLKYYIAPHPMPNDNVEMRFLSEAAVSHVVNSTKEPKQLDSMRHFGLDYQVVETLLMYCLTGVESDFVLPSWDVDNWEWYQDPGYLQELRAHHRIPDPAPQAPGALSPILHRRPLKRVLFVDAMLRKNVRELSDDTLYSSLRHNHAIGEYFSVGLTDRNGAATRTVNFYGTSTRLPQNHPCSINALQNQLEALGLDLPQNADVRFNLIYFVDWSERHVRGMKFQSSTGDYDIKQLRNIMPMFKNLDTYIVRAGIYNTGLRLELSAKLR